MDTVIFDDYGIEIIKKSDKFFIRYDGGEIVVQIIETEITENEAITAQLSEKDAYDVILKTQARSELPNAENISVDAALRCEANMPCPKAGFWWTVAKQNSRAQFKQGDIMPDFPNSHYGKTIWMLDKNQQ